MVTGFANRYEVAAIDRFINYKKATTAAPVIGDVVGYDVNQPNMFFVDSGVGNNGNDGRDPRFPLAGVDAAIGKCVANRGDVIFVMPGHTESIAAAAGWDCDVAGVSIIGLGNGTNRPQITFITDTAADIDIDAANVTIANISFINDIDGLAAPIDVNAAYFTIEDCEFRDDTAAKQTIRWILGDANADFMTVRRCMNKGSDTAGSTAFITLNGADHVVIEDCTSHGDFSAANIQVVTAAVTDVLITRNHLENANAVDVNIELFAAATGWVSNNFCRVATDAQVTWINTPGNTQLFENYGVNNSGERGIAIGTASV